MVQRGHFHGDGSFVSLKIIVIDRVGRGDEWFVVVFNNPINAIEQLLRCEMDYLMLPVGQLADCSAHA